MKGRLHFLIVAVGLGLVSFGCQSQRAGTQSESASLNPPAPTGTVEIEVPKPPPPPRYPRPETVRGLYLTAWVAGSTVRRAELLEIVASTELNAVVIDIRDVGLNYWDMGIELSDQAKATRIAIPRPDELMDLLEEKGVYPIARIACFVDDKLTIHDPARAVQRANGSVWRERGGRRWLDPYNKDNWEYIGQIVDFAVEVGFAEIQLDYVRMPTGGRKSTMHFPAKAGWPEETTESQVIQAFAQFIRDRLPENVPLSADIFGIVSSGDWDQGIGQDLEFFPQPFDILCPMVYPNHYAPGEYGIRDPNANPYAILIESVGDFVEALPDKLIRPWLQTFGGYGEDEVREQIRAIKELGVNEYLLWHADNKYEGVVPADTSDLDPQVEEAPQDITAPQGDNPISEPPFDYGTGRGLR